MVKHLKSLLDNKEIKNAGWIIGGKVAQMALSLVVSIWSARYLGPSNYGLLNYISAYTAFFTSLCTLGITSSVLVNEFTKKPDEEGTTLGTTIGLRLLSSILSAMMVVSIVYIVDEGDPLLLWIAIFSSAGLIFNVFDVIEFWFLKRYMSKITSIASFAGYCATSVYKIFLLVTGKSVIYFAIANSVDYLVIAVILFAVYKKNNGQRLSFSMNRGREILSVSYHFILSGMMVAIYGQTDKLMLKFMLSETDVGFYSTASSLSTIWVFVLSAIISSLSPTIVRFKKEGNEQAYRKKNCQLYRIVFYFSTCVSGLITLLAPIIVRVLYGEAYLGSIAPLRVITWYVAFSYLGVARDIWLVCENKQKYSKYIYIIAAVANVGMNYLLIPKLGAAGAAAATLITQIMTSILVPLLWRDMRDNVKLMLQGILFIDYLRDNSTKENKNVK